MVPEGWVKIRLGSVAELQRGFDLPSSQRIDGSVPIVSSGGVTGYHSEAKSKAPGVVTGRYGSIGDVFYLEEDYWPLNTSLWVKDFHGNYEKFVYYLLCNFDFKKFSDKTGVPGVNRNDLHAVKVGLPSIPEQKKIAQILSTWDKAISSTEQLLANSQQQKKALMQQLLTGKKRLLDKNGVRFGGEWKKGKLSDIANIDSGYAFKSADFTDSEKGIPIIRMSDFKTGGVDISNAAKVIPETTIGLDRFRLKNGDFVFGMSGSLSNYGWVKEQDLPCFLNQRVGRILAKECAVQMFVTYLYLSDKIQQSILDKAAGAAQLNISSTDLRKTIVHYPGFEEQQKIAAVLSTADQEISALKQKLDALKQEKKALMQQLLTGKRRVKLN
ncbi:type I restriction endonuclease subunit R [Thalassolituus oleivorans]|jgi:type I restriction enzyme S subunit|uniref:restriction endonuclease subunit S n=1 Tax=Thalassolituus oleivorans TaxID=187493 RepID=UPI000949306E|nr:restriction endonuclease subunit S [Thalassolituus oleivorans]APR65988.1 type I restriction endonuclease subunit R [Thalassolituus oleivorans]